MRLISKLAVASTLLAVVFVGAAVAQGLRASVPFAFRAGDSVLPAGDYTVTIDRSSHRLAVYGADGRLRCHLPILTGAELDISKPAALFFHRYGDTYFLRAVKPASGAEGFVLAASGAERERASQDRRTQLAKVRVPAK